MRVERNNQSAINFYKVKQILLKIMFERFNSFRFGAFINDE